MNKRKTKRPYVLATIRIKPIRGGLEIDALTINISKNGVGLYSKKQMKKGRRVVVKVTFFDGKGMKTSEDMKGTVSWSQKLGKQFAVGIKFDESINRKNYPVLHTCLVYAQKNI
ncbi:MAG: PilZ domain-containing protein [Thermodesulfobacteriota bacterium]